MTSHESLISLEAASQSFGERVILENLSWELRRGDCAVILGPSGGGKSVFLSIILGFRRSDSGAVRYADGLGEDLFRRVAVLFQEDALLDDRTVEANLVIALIERADVFGGPFTHEDESAIVKALEEVGLDPTKVRGLLPAELSGGMRRRVALARALLRRPEILVADEPTSGLDPDTARAVYELMARLIADKGLSSIIITHDPVCASILGNPVYYFTPREGALRKFEWTKQERPAPQAILDWMGQVRGEPLPVHATQLEISPKEPNLDLRAVAESAMKQTFEAIGRAVFLFANLGVAPSGNLLARQIKQWGLHSLPLFTLIFALLGVVLQIQAVRAVGDLGFSNRLPELLTVGLARLAPIIAGFLIAGRCGSAATAQVGWMRLAKQDQALRTMRIEPDRTFFPPLAFSWLVCAPALALWGMISAWSAAWLVLRLQLSSARITARFFASQVMESLTASMLGAAMLKSALIALGMAALAYSAGASPKRSASDVSRAITRGLVLSFAWISIVDAVVSLLIAD